MAAKPKKKSAAARKQAEADADSSKSIQEQTAAFLKAGGTVEVIPSGVSGQQSMAPGRKHITLGNKSSTYNKPSA